MESTPESLKLQPSENSTSNSSPNNHIITKPSFFSKLFCSKCFPCLKDKNRFLDSELRRKIWKRIFSKSKDKSNNMNLNDPLDILAHLYTDNDKKSIEMLNSCRINPNFMNIKKKRDDLEFYIPQLCVFLIFHENCSNNSLNEFIENACKLNFFFAHKIYWNLYSMNKIIKNESTQEFPIIKSLFEICCKTNDKKILMAFSFIFNEFLENYKKIKDKEKIKDVVLLDENYFLQNLYNNFFGFKIKPYISINKSLATENGFLSTITFWEDIMSINELANQLKKEERLFFVKSKLNEINMRLPAAVYIPFISRSIRNHCILKIDVEETFFFSSKERAPLLLYFEIFRIEEFIDSNLKIIDSSYFEDEMLLEQFEKTFPSHEITFFNQFLSKPVRLREEKNYDFKQIKKNRNSPLAFFFKENPNKEKSKSPSPTRFHHPEIDKMPCSLREIDKTQDHFVTYKTEQSPFYNTNSGKYESPIDFSYSSSQPSEEDITKNESKKELELKIPKIPNNINIDDFPQGVFGEQSKEKKKRLKNNSEYKILKSLQIIPLIIKSGENLKQEQFALQLITLFSHIFTLEKINLKLRPYEVLAISPNCGIIEMINDAVTIDKLKRSLYNQYNEMVSLDSFFKKYYGKKVKDAKYKFCSSLAAYCLICYFLQVKDRHNGNILLHKSGYIIHIDFDFFLSNYPGKGIELEKVPFKLISEYIEVLGGQNSSLFKRFRKLIFQGFKAVKKHQEKIIVPIKMMYSSYGDTLSCFKGGENCLIELEKRMNPDVGDDGELNIFIQNLINQSLDNLRTKWYDKFQYYCQGIFY